MVTNDEVARWYRHQGDLTRYLGAGLAGIALFGGGYMETGSFVDDHPWTRAVFLSAGLISGACLGFAYAKLIQDAVKLERRIASQASFGQTAFDAQIDSPDQWTAPLFFAGVFAVVATGGWLLVIAWLDAA
jgi:hypothetical protein